MKIPKELKQLVKDMINAKKNNGLHVDFSRTTNIIKSYNPENGAWEEVIKTTNISMEKTETNYLTEEESRKRCIY